MREPFDDPAYLFELKHDGFRAVCYIEDSECRLVSRNLRNLRQVAQPGITTPFPPFDDTGGSSTNVENSCRIISFWIAAISSDFFIERLATDVL